MCRCQVAINPSDERLWKGTLSDGLYNCNGVKDLLATPPKLNICDDPNNSYETDSIKIETAEFNDWVIPSGWDDSATDNPNFIKEDLWCNPANAVGQEVSPFQCLDIKCYMERKLGTGDDAQDMQFTPAAGAPDKLIIRPGRARIYFNQTTYKKGAGNGPIISAGAAASATKENIEIEIKTGAKLGLVGGAVLATIFVTLF